MLLHLFRLQLITEGLLLQFIIVNYDSSFFSLCTDFWIKYNLIKVVPVIEDKTSVEVHCTQHSLPGYWKQLTIHFQRIFDNTILCSFFWTVLYLMRLFEISSWLLRTFVTVAYHHRLKRLIDKHRKCAYQK